MASVREALVGGRVILERISGLHIKIFGQCVQAVRKGDVPNFLGEGNADDAVVVKETEGSNSNHCNDIGNFIYE